MSHRETTSSLPNDVDEMCMANLLDASHEVIYFKDLQSRFIRVSIGCATQHGLTQEQMIGRTDFDLFTEAHASVAFADEQAIIATGEPVLNKDERERYQERPDAWVSSSKFPLRGTDGTIVGTFGISRDVTRLVVAERAAARAAADAKAANEELRRVEAQLRAVLDGSTDAIAKYDAELRYQYINPAGEQSRGATLDELIGRTDRETGMAEDSLRVWEPALRGVLETGVSDEVEFSVLGADGEESWFHTSLSPDRDAGGAVVGVLTSMRDVSELKRAEQALAHQAMHDSVTGLANRYVLTDRLNQALVRMERAPSRLALFFIDLDYFKDVNDTYGHEVGDRVLIEFARRLEGVARRQDTVARLGGDEFVLLCDGMHDDGDVHLIAARVVDALADPYEEAGLSIRLSASVGAVVTDEPDAAAADLLRNADAAMYRAKQGGRNRFTVYDPDARAQPTASAELEGELRFALDRGEFRLLYQPLLSLSDQRLLGFEALIRWEHPERGMVGPDEFLAASEDRGLIGAIGTWVLDTACAQLAAWSDARPAGTVPLLMAVNVSGHQLRERGFVGLVRDTLARHDVAPERLRLELTERTLVQDGAAARDTLESLVALGVQLAVDDFGATYTSLSRLPYFPVSVVKLDQLTPGARRQDVAAAVIAMAHGLGMSVVGEGIETVDQLSELVRLACDDGQGFLLGHPLGPVEVDRLLAADAGRVVDPA